jgi:hypothetical protein
MIFSSRQSPPFMAGYVEELRKEGQSQWDRLNRSVCASPQSAETMSYIENKVVKVMKLKYCLGRRRFCGTAK